MWLIIICLLALALLPFFLRTEQKENVQEKEALDNLEKKWLDALEKEGIELNINGLAQLVAHGRTSDAGLLLEYFVGKCRLIANLVPEDVRIKVDSLDMRSRRVIEHLRDHDLCCESMDAYSAVLESLAPLIIRENIPITISGIAQLLSQERLNDAERLARHVPSVIQRNEPGRPVSAWWDNLWLAGLELLLDRCRPIALEHRKALARRRRQLIVVGEYGEKNTDGWDREKLYFIKNLLAPEIQKAFHVLEWEKNERNFFLHRDYFPSDDPTVIAQLDQLIEKIVAAADFERTVESANRFLTEQNLADNSLQSTRELGSAGDGPAVNSAKIGTEYEQQCIAEFLRCGIQASGTKATGDQGADILLQIGEKTGVVQCKNYFSPVGNKAVQEVHAARDWHQADFAAVITNTSYTKEAKKLAHFLDVKLLHHEQIRDYVQNLKQQAS